MALMALASCVSKPEQGAIDWNKVPNNQGQNQGGGNPSDSEVKTITPTTALGDPSENTTNLRYEIGLSVNITDDTVEKELIAMNKAGIKWIELKFKYSTYDFVNRSDENILSSFRVIDGLLKKYDIQVWSCHLPYENATWTNPGAIDEKVRQQSEDYLKHVISLVNYFPVKCYVLHAGKGSIGNMSTAVSQARKTIAVLKAEADKIGARICVENLVGSLAYLYNDVNAIVSGFDDVWYTLDVGHANITASKAGGLTPSVYAQRIGAKLGTVHIDDNMGSEDNHLLPGRGTIKDWAETYRAFLKDCRYRGVYMFEPSGTSYSAAEAVYAYQHTILESLK